MARTDLIRTERGLNYLVGAITDITKLRQRELMLEEASRKTADLLKDIEDIISNIDVGILVLDSALNIQMMNEAYHRHLWKDMPRDWLDSLIGQPFAILLEESHRRLGIANPLGRLPSSANGGDPGVADRPARNRAA